jgi:alkylation response protein AidB-like acyl-CoA dehydrogenase
VAETNALSVGSPADVVALVDALFRSAPDHSTSPVAFLGHKFDLGLARVDFAVGFGGLGLSHSLQSVIDADIADRGGPRLSGLHIVNGLAAAVIHTHGSDEQKARFLRPLFSGEHIWCQLFSEPGAGSDLACLATRARSDGDHWVISGQKVWTSMADRASWGLLIARSDPDVPKHAGLTCFLIDMTSPGVDVRPLRQVTGESEYCEVFLSDVVVSSSCQVGQPGAGWALAQTALIGERTTLGDGRSTHQPIDIAIELLRSQTATRPNSAVDRDRLMRLIIEHRVIRQLRRRLPSLSPRSGASLVKVAWAEHNQRVYEFCVDIGGAHGMLFDYRGSDRPEPETSRAFLRSRANTLEGGTTEVHKTLIGERGLGLPAETRIDKDLPWRMAPR